MTAPSALARDSGYHRFRLVVVVGSVIAAIIGSALLATLHSGEKVTTRGVTETLRVPGHPGWLAAGPDALWVALSGDPQRPAGNRPLLRLDLATGTVVQTVRLGGEASYLAHVGQTLIASVKPLGARGYGPRRLLALFWRSGIVLAARPFDGPVDQVAGAGSLLWALEDRPGTLFALDPYTLAPAGVPIRLSTGRTLGLTAGAGYLWVTAADAGDVIRIDPATRATRRTHVGGHPVGIVAAAGSVWFVDRTGATVDRLDPGTLRAVGEPIHVGTTPTWLAVAGNSLYVTDQNSGTITRIDLHSGRTVGPPIRIAPPAQDAVAPAIASTGESVWVSSHASNTLTRISTPASSQTSVHGKVTLRYRAPRGVDQTIPNGGVAATGDFTATGAITDHGTFTDYRTADRTGNTAEIRSVTVGKKGTIVFLITFLKNGSELWTITSATKTYAGLQGRGTQVVDDYESIPAIFVMKGTVSR